MKNPIRIKRKRLKTRIRRKDFVKKRNIRRNNQPVPTKKEIVVTVQPARNIEGKIIFENNKAKYVITGEKTVTQKLHKSLLLPGDGVLPKRIKHKEKNEKTRKYHQN